MTETQIDKKWLEPDKNGFYVDEGVLEQETVIISSGRPDAGLEVKPQALLQALEAQVGDFAS